MATMTIELPDAVKQVVQARALKGGFARMEDYLEALIVANAGEPVSAEVEALVLEGLKSPSRVMTREDWEVQKQKLVERHQGRKE